MEFPPGGRQRYGCESEETMQRQPRRTTHRPSRLRWRLPPSKAIGHWRSLPSSSSLPQSDLVRASPSRTLKKLTFCGSKFLTEVVFLVDFEGWVVFLP